MKEETKTKIYDVLHRISECYLFYRFLFIINLPNMFYVPFAVLVLHEHVDGVKIFNSCTGWIFSLLCWKSMRWELFVTQCKELIRRIKERW